MSDKIVRYYDETKNARNAYLPGVPLRDITEDEWNALTEHEQLSTDAAGFYLKSRPRSADAKAEDAPSDKEK